MNVYPVVKTKDICSDYDVKINGINVPLCTARVSKVPFNRRWPGHQRQTEQSELINFALLSANEPLDIEITPKKAFDNAAIRPQSLGIIPKTENGVIKLHIDKPAYFTVEPFGVNQALHFFIDPEKDYGISETDENVIYFGKGVHEAGTITLDSNQTLYIDEGAVLYACIKSCDAENIKILGRGILDNSHNTEQILYEVNAVGNEMAVNNAKRQHTIQLEYCKNIEIDGITIRDSLVYNIRPIACENIAIRNVKIIGCWRYNSDGIDMHNCVNVDISKCFIRTFDDSICVKGFDPFGDDNGMLHNGILYDTFKNVKIHDCVIWNDWGKALEIGAETHGREITDINFYDCDIIHVNAAALDCTNVDEADVHDCVYENINIEYGDFVLPPLIQNEDFEEYDYSITGYVPLLAGASVEYHAEYSQTKNKRGKTRNILFKNLRLFGKIPPRICIRGYDNDSKCSNITFSDLYWNGEKITDKKCMEINEFCENIIVK